MSQNYAKFQIEGDIVMAEVKTGKRSGKPYGRITIATGMAGHDFFVEPEMITDGTYKRGVRVKVTGDVGKEGFNPTLANEVIEIIAKKQAA